MINLQNILETFIKCGEPPDILSIEFTDENKPYIQFEWISGYLKGKILKFKYNKNIYDRLLSVFNNYWEKEKRKMEIFRLDNSCKKVNYLPEIFIFNDGNLIIL